MMYHVQEWMVTGDSGLISANVVLPVEKVNKEKYVSVTIQLHNLVAQNAYCQMEVEIEEHRNLSTNYARLPNAQLMETGESGLVLLPVVPLVMKVNIQEAVNVIIHQLQMVVWIVYYLAKLTKEE